MKDVLIYEDNFKDRGFEVCTPQECADLFGKPVKSKGKVYQPCPHGKKEKKL